MQPSPTHSGVNPTQSQQYPNRPGMASPPQAANGRPPPPHPMGPGHQPFNRPPMPPGARPPMQPQGQPRPMYPQSSPQRPGQPLYAGQPLPGRPPAQGQQQQTRPQQPMMPQQSLPQQQPVRPYHQSPPMISHQSPQQQQVTLQQSPQQQPHVLQQSPQQQPQPAHPSSPTESHAPATAEGRRRRAYAPDITKAYAGDSAPAQGGYMQQPQTYGAPEYGDGVNSMTNQFANASLGPQTYRPPNANSVPLIGAAPTVSDLHTPPPQVNLPPNTAITNSPYANCDPSYKCCTLNAVPSTEALLKKSRMPFALVLAPYRSPEDEEPPVVKDSVIARCRRCRTYINPFVTFVEGGQRWKCNMCFLLNDVPAAFDFDPQTQQPTDRWQRKELNHGCVEFVAPTEYMVRSPQAPAYVFIIDVSYSAIQSGMVATASRIIQDALERIPNDEGRTTIALITVDSSLHFYSLNRESGPKMSVVSDLDDVFLPEPTDLLANLKDSMGTIEKLLNNLPEMFKNTVNVNNALGPALQAAFKMLSANGGKIICLQSTLPNTGTGSLKSREDVKLLGTPKESNLLNSASPFYKSFSVDCSRSQVACDMLIFGGHYSDVATLSCLPHYTGGQTYFYPGFNAARVEDATKLSHELSRLLEEKIGLEAVIRIRASRGLRMSAFHGNFFIRSTDLLALPNVPRDQSYCVEVAIEDDIKTSTVCFQTALLHTTCTGERRIRVVTLCLPVSNSIPDMYASANQTALAAYLGAKGVERGLSSKLDDAREAIVNKIVDIFGVYKTHVLGSPQGTQTQLQAPDNLKLLPILSLALIKHDGLRQSSQIPSDMRSNAMNLLRTMPLQLLIPFLHPNFYSLHNMPANLGLEGNPIFPPVLNLTSEKLESHGCYLLENGQNIFIFVGPGVVPQLCKDLFDEPSYESLRSGKCTLRELDTSINRAVRRIVDTVREMRRGNYYPTLYLVKDTGDQPLRQWFMSFLLEDRTENVMSYPQFLHHVKDRVGSGSF